MPGRTIAVDLDDTLNDFTQTLRTTRFVHDGSYPFPEEVFQEYLGRIRGEVPEPGELLSTEYSYFRYRIHQACYAQAGARADGVEFMRWLRAEGWRIAICTSRDLRRAGACTRRWLEENGIPFDHLFFALNKVVFCRLWEIPHLVDDDPFNVVHGGNYGVNVFYPRMDKHRNLDVAGARGFESFEEIKPWIRG